MPPNFSKDLFLCSRGQMRFNVNFCKENDELRYYIEFGGGAVDEGQGPFTITLVDPGSSSSHQEVPNRETYSSEYVLNCCIRDEILKLLRFRITKSKQLSNQFDPNNILLRRISWEDALKQYSVNKASISRIPKVPGAIIIGGLIPVVSVENSILPSTQTRENDRDESNIEVENESDGDSDISDKNSTSSESSVMVIPVKRKSKRNDFTPEERIKIVRFVVEHNAFDGLKGIPLWRKMAKCFSRHTWQSLKEHFKKKIYPCLGNDEYDLDEETLLKFLDVKVARRSKSKPCPKSKKVTNRQTFFETTGRHQSKVQEASGSGAPNGLEKFEAGSTGSSPASQKENHVRDLQYELGDSDSPFTDSREHRRTSPRKTLAATPPRPQSSPASLPSEHRKSPRMKDTVKYFSEESDECCADNVKTSPRKKINFETVESDESYNLSDLGSICPVESDGEDSDSEETDKSGECSDEPDESSSSSDNEVIDLVDMPLRGAVRTSPRVKYTKKTMTVESNGNEREQSEESFTIDHRDSLLNSSSQIITRTDEKDSWSDSSCDFTPYSSCQRTQIVEHNPRSVSASISPSGHKNKNRVEIDHSDFGCRSPQRAALQASKVVPPSPSIKSKGTNTSIEATTSDFSSQRSSKEPKRRDASMQTDPENMNYHIALPPARLMNSNGVQTDWNLTVDEGELEQLESEPLTFVPCSPGSALGKDSDSESVSSDAEKEKTAGLLTTTPLSKDASSEPVASVVGPPIRRKAMRKSNSDSVLMNIFRMISPSRNTRAAARNLHGVGNASSKEVEISLRKESSCSPGKSPENALAAKQAGAKSMNIISKMMGESSSGTGIRHSPKKVYNSEDSLPHEKEISLNKETLRFSPRKRNLSDNNEHSPVRRTDQKKNKSLGLHGEVGCSKEPDLKRSRTKEDESDTLVLAAFTRAKAKIDQRPKRVTKNIKGGQSSL